MLEVGKPAPDFELLDQDNNTVKLSEFRGKKVVVFAYPKADTPGCTTQACGFRDEFPRIEAKNAVVFGLSPDVPKDLKAWKDLKGFQYSLLSDPDHKVLEAWGAWGEKTSFGKTSVGVLRSHWVIDEQGNVLDVQMLVKPEDSVKKALKVLGEA